MINLSLLCFLIVTFLGMCGMLGYVLSAYTQLLAERDTLKAELKKRQEQTP
jgi:hypothetical protein